MQDSPAAGTQVTEAPSEEGTIEFMPNLSASFALSFEGMTAAVTAEVTVNTNPRMDRFLNDNGFIIEHLDG
ncbi:hypothetical protein GCM10009415_37810 [Chitinophaga japonensis]